MQKIDETATTTTWLLKGKEAKLVADAYESMNLKIQDISKRHDDETKTLRDEAKAELDAIHARHQEEIQAAQKGIEVRLSEAVKPYQEEASAASMDFHNTLWGLNAKMSRDKLPMINLNQYAAGSDAVVVMEQR